MFKYPIFWVLFLSLTVQGLWACAQESQKQERGMGAAEASEAHEHFPVQRTEAQWKAILPDQTFRVMRKEATERAFSGKYYKSEADGIYYCAACGNPLFDSRHKFHSGTGWPSFFKPISSAQIGKKDDYTLFGSKRIEVHCARCGGHLGHVFNDGPRPTGLRYCLNSAALNFRRRGEAPPPLLK